MIRSKGNENRLIFPPFPIGFTSLLYLTNPYHTFLSDSYRKISHLEQPVPKKAYLTQNPIKFDETKYLETRNKYISIHILYYSTWGHQKAVKWHVLDCKFWKLQEQCKDATQISSFFIPSFSNPPQPPNLSLWIKFIQFSLY